MTLIKFIAAIENVNPATHDMQSHYSSPHIAGIKALRKSEHKSI